jgi:alpha-ketoglutarate-dependent taurine dioxygenase
MLHIELRARGWACVKGIKSQSELLELARTVGRPVRSPTGELVKELTPIPQAQARRGTLSDAYATGSFPLHTDTAFWALPSRYLVFRARGDVRRHTTILAFADIFHEGPPGLRALAERSVWLVRTPSEIFYCSMKFVSKVGMGWRYDPHCMSPANDAAIKVREQLDPLLACSRIQCIQWTNDLAIILCNWEILHGRGPSPPAETRRILERIYVE